MKNTPRSTIIALTTLLLLTGCNKAPEEKKAAPPPATTQTAGTTQTPAAQAAPSPMDQLKNSVNALGANTKQAVNQMAALTSKVAEQSAQPIVDQARESGKSALATTAAVLGQASTALQEMTTALENPALIKQGAQVAQKCQGCHDLTAARNNRIGPYLFGIIGQPAAQVPGFKYSDTHKQITQEKRITWDETTLDRYLTDPKSMIPNNRMVFPGLPNQADRTALIAFLKSLK